MKFIKQGSIETLENDVFRAKGLLYANDLPKVLWCEQPEAGTDFIIKYNKETNETTTLSKYSIAFSDWDGSILTQTLYNEGETIVIPSNPTREGYVFTGWSPSISQIAITCATYYAQYEKYIPMTIAEFADGTTKEYDIRGELKPTEVYSIGTYEQVYYSTYDEAVQGWENSIYEDYPGRITTSLPVNIPYKGFPTFSSIEEGKKCRQYINKSTGSLFTDAVTVKLSHNITSIGNQSFEGCQKITHVDIPHSVTSIGYSAFRNCTQLNTISIPDSITSIGDYAFYQCSNLNSISIPDSVNNLGKKVFYNCTNLQIASVSNNITIIPEGLFNRCTSLKQVYISNNTTYIGYEAFYDCTHLIKLNSSIDGECKLPNNITTVDVRGLCATPFTTIYLPDSLEELKDRAFCNCTECYCIIYKDVNYNINNNSYAKKLLEKELTKNGVSYLDFACLPNHFDD